MADGTAAGVAGRRPAGLRARLSLAASAVLLALGSPAFGQAGPAVPVHVGGGFGVPACDARGTLSPATPGAESVEISSGPTGSFRAIGRVPAGLEVFVCDENGTFRGVIYGEGDCGLADPMERRAAYRGACASGWVHNRQVEPSDANAV